MSKGIGGSPAVADPRCILAACLASLLVIAPCASAEIIEVMPGESIQAAIDAAGDGDEIVVAPGTYGERLDLHGKAIRLGSASGPALTRLDGAGLGGRVITCSSGETLSTVIEGFTVSNGRAMHGAGMLIEDASPLVLDCIFEFNVAESRGGAMRIVGASEPVITNCTFAENTAEYGGAVSDADSSPIFVACAFIANGGATIGGGAMHNSRSTPTVLGCDFRENSAWDDGSGIYNKFCDSFPIKDCAFISNVGRGDGGGIYNWDSDPVIDGCRFEGNRVRNDAWNDGGAIVIKSYSNPVVTNCVFLGNVTEDGNYPNAANRGGAIFVRLQSVPVISHCSFFGNSGSLGGAIGIQDSHPLIVDCEFRGNTAENEGGAIFSSYASDPVIARCLIALNSAGYGGGGVAIRIESGTRIENSRFYANEAYVGGGVFATDDVLGAGAPSVTSSLFALNTASLGGGVWNRRSALTMSNCTLSGNAATQGGGLGFAVEGDGSIVANCVVWGNTAVEAGASIGGAGAPAVRFSNIEGGWPGEGNLDLDPAFIDPDGPDDDPQTWADNVYHLDAGSPCIDVGDTHEVEPGATDIDGQPRVTNGIVDQGADEVFSSCPTDLDGDGIVDFLDLVFALSFWGESEVIADINGNGTVGFDDLLLILSHWGACPDGMT